MEDSGPGAPWLRQPKGKVLATSLAHGSRAAWPGPGLVSLSVGHASTLATGLADE